VTVISTVGHDLSHASFRLVEESTPTPTEPTPTEPTPTEPTPTEPTPTEPTPTEPTPTQPTPTPTTPTPTPEIEVDPLVLSGICNDSASISWSVSNGNNFDIAYSWSANNGESGSGIVNANGSASFSSSYNAFSITLNYAEEIDPKEVQASGERCAPKNDTPEPTKEVTEQPTEETVAKVDPQPDQPAGGSGPSFLSFFAPAGMIMLAAASGLVVAKRLKTKPQLNK